MKAKFTLPDNNNLKAEFSMPKNKEFVSSFSIDKTKTIATKAELNAEIEARIESDNNLHFKIEQVESEIPDISGLATKEELEQVEDSIPDVSNLATKNELQEVESAIPTKASDIDALPNTTTINDLTTQKQQNAINSGITASKVNSIDTALQPNDNITELNNNAGFITNAVANLTNYYLKSETYTKQEINSLIADIPKFTVNVVQELPLIGQPMILYLVPKDGDAPDVHNEYIWITSTSSYELIGTTAIDLDGYATEEWVQNQGYTKNKGTVTSVNNIQPVNGNVDITVPEANDGLLTIRQGGITKGTFSANSKNNVTVDLDEGGSGEVSYNNIVYPSSMYIDTKSANGNLTSVETFTFNSLRKIDLFHKNAVEAGNYYGTGLLLGIYIDDNNYFGICRRSYDLEIINMSNGQLLNHERFANGVRTLSNYANVYFCIDFTINKLKVIGSNGTPTTLFDFDFSSWDLSTLTNFKIIAGVGKYSGLQYSAYLRINDYYDIDTFLSQKMKVDAYNAFPIKNDGNICIEPEYLRIGGTVQQTISQTHKISNGPSSTMTYFALSSYSNQLSSFYNVGSLVKFRIIDGNAFIGEGVTTQNITLLDENMNFLASLSGGTSYELTNDTWYYIYFQGDGSRPYAYTASYGIRMQGTFTIEAEAIYAGYPRSITICAETCNGNYVTGAIPLKAYNIIFSEYNNFYTNVTGYYAPIGALVIHSTGDIYMYNGTKWEKINS